MYFNMVDVQEAEDGCLKLSKESKFALPLPFGSIQALKGLHDTHPYW